MAKSLKNEWIGARIDSELKEAVEKYIDREDMTMGQLLRKAIKEYIANHPGEE